MKATIFISTLFALVVAVGSCTKCKTCTPYLYSSANNKFGAVDTFKPGNKGATAVKVCDKTDITAYENVITTDASRDTIRFICE